MERESGSRLVRVSMGEISIGGMENGLELVGENEVPRGKRSALERGQQRRKECLSRISSTRIGNTGRMRWSLRMLTDKTQRTEMETLKSKVECIGSGK